MRPFSGEAHEKISVFRPRASINVIDNCAVCHWRLDVRVLERSVYVRVTDISDRRKRMNGRETARRNDDTTHALIRIICLILDWQR